MARPLHLVVLWPDLAARISVPVHECGLQKVSDTGHFWSETYEAPEHKSQDGALREIEDDYRQEKQLINVMLQRLSSPHMPQHRPSEHCD